MTTSNTIKFLKSRRMASATLFCALSATIFVCVHLARAGGAVTPLNISQVPLTITQPVHPQVLIALGNSESMDGNLAGAIMTGSGALASGVASLKNSSSPQNYVVPAGFTPPKQAAVAGSAPYTVASNGKLFDNGDSRMNVAKAGIQAIIQSYMVNTDFALETYQTSNVGVYDTWVYYMSNSSGFAFSSTNTGGGVYVANPCLAYSAAATSTVKNNCSDIAGSGLYTASSVSTSPYIKIGKSSDDPDINDVLYVPTGSGSPGVYVDYGTIDPATPFPPNRTLAQYHDSGRGAADRTDKRWLCAVLQTGPVQPAWVRLRCVADRERGSNNCPDDFFWKSADSCYGQHGSQCLHALLGARNERCQYG